MNSLQGTPRIHVILKTVLTSVASNPKNTPFNCDSGLQALDIIHRKAIIDEEWTERSPRSFRWIGYRLSQSFEAGSPIDDGGIHISRVSARISLVENVTAPRETVEGVLAEVNRYAIGSTYVYDIEGHSVSSLSTSIVHADTVEWRSELHTALAMCQIGQAETEADYLAEVLRGTVATRPHSTLGFRTQPLEMVTAIDSVFGRGGGESSRYAKASEFQAIDDIARHGNTATCGGDETGIAIEVPFGREASLIQLDTGFRHRRVGSGLSFAIHLPLDPGFRTCAAFAADMNREQAAGKPNIIQFGAWCVTTSGDRNMVTFTGFIPNYLYRPGVAQDVFYSSVKRAQWANQRFNPGVPEVDAWALLQSRMRRQSNDPLFKRFLRSWSKRRSGRSGRVQ